MTDIDTSSADRFVAIANAKMADFTRIIDEQPPTNKARALIVLCDMWAGIRGDLEAAIRAREEIYEAASAKKDLKALTYLTRDATLITAIATYNFRSRIFFGDAASGERVNVGCDSEIDLDHRVRRRCALRPGRRDVPRSQRPHRRHVDDRGHRSDDLSRCASA